MSKVSRLLDFLLSRLVIYLFAFIWIRYNVDQLWVAAAGAGAVTVALSIMITLVGRSSRARRALSSAERARMEDAMTQLIFAGAQKSLDFFFGFLAQKYSTVRLADCLLVDNGQNKTLVFTWFRHSKLDADGLADMVAAASEYRTNRVLAFTNGLDATAVQAASRLEGVGVALASSEDTFRFLVKHNAFPPQTVKTGKAKRRLLRETLAVALSRKNVKGFMFGSVILILSSFFTIYSLYYLIAASVLLVLSLLSFINFKHKNCASVSSPDL